MESRDAPTVRRPGTAESTLWNPSWETHSSSFLSQSQDLAVSGQLGNLPWNEQLGGPGCPVPRSGWAASMTRERSESFRHLSYHQLFFTSPTE